MIQPELKAYRRCSDRHVLVLETNLTYVEKCQIFHYADLVRKAGNELTGIMKKRYDQLVRTKRYRKLKSLYKSKKIDRLGETKIMNCGMEATIIRYKVLPFSGPFFYVADFLTHYK